MDAMDEDYATCTQRSSLQRTNLRRSAPDAADAAHTKPQARQLVCWPGDLSLLLPSPASCESVILEGTGPLKRQLVCRCVPYVRRRTKNAQRH
jgi:hypothetical protein